MDSDSSKAICVGVKDMSIGKKRKVSAVEASDEHIEALEFKQNRIKHKLETLESTKEESSIHPTDYKQLLMDHSELLSDLISLQKLKRELIRIMED